MSRMLFAGLLLSGLTLLGLAAFIYFAPRDAASVTIDQPEREFPEAAAGQSVPVFRCPQSDAPGRPHCGAGGVLRGKLSLPCEARGAVRRGRRRDGGRRLHAGTGNPGPVPGAAPRLCRRPGPA